MRCASRTVTRPWSTASPSTSSIRSREIITISSGPIRFLRSASRSSATVLASTPALRAPRRRSWRCCSPPCAPSACAPWPCRPCSRPPCARRRCGRRGLRAPLRAASTRAEALERLRGGLRSSTWPSRSTCSCRCALRHDALLRGRRAADYRTNVATTGAWSESRMRSPSASGSSRSLGRQPARRARPPAGRARAGGRSRAERSARRARSRRAARRTAPDRAPGAG